MRPVRIVTDTCSDLSKDLREKYDIDYMMMNTIKDNRGGSHSQGFPRRDHLLH